MFLSRVTCDEVKEKNENQLNGGFEVPNCHSYICDVYLIDYMPTGESRQRFVIIF